MPPKRQKISVGKKTNTVTTKDNEEQRASNVGISSNKRSMERRQQKTAEDADIVLAKCRQLRDFMRQQTNQSQVYSSLKSEGIQPEAAAIGSAGTSSAASSIVAKQEDAHSRKKILVQDLKDADEKWNGVVEVSQMPTDQVIEGIEAVSLQIAKSILIENKGFALDIPSRAASNQIYIPELDRYADWKKFLCLFTYFQWFVAPNQWQFLLSLSPAFSDFISTQELY